MRQNCRCSKGLPQEMPYKRCRRDRSEGSGEAPLAACCLRQEGYLPLCRREEGLRCNLWGGGNPCRFMRNPDTRLLGTLFQPVEHGSCDMPAAHTEGAEGCKDKGEG